MLGEAPEPGDASRLGASSCLRNVSGFGNAAFRHPFERPCVAHLSDQRHSVRVLPLRDSRPSHSGRALLVSARQLVSTLLLHSVPVLALAAASLFVAAAFPATANLFVAAGFPTAAGLPVPLCISGAVSAFHGSRSSLSR